MSPRRPDGGGATPLPETLPCRCEFEVVIAGAGPVGLLLALRLHQLGLDVLLLEREPRRPLRFRALGIHPPSLERLARLGVLHTLLNQGVPVTTARVHGRDGRELGRLELGQLLPGPRPFVLACPQHRIEAVLEEELERRAPGRLWRGAALVRLVQRARQVELTVARDHGPSPAEGPGPAHETVLQARILVGCDGRDSTCRQLLEFECEERLYPEHYVLADWPDRSGLERDAALYLHEAGLLESFPLPGGQRRWVASFSTAPGPDMLPRLQRAVLQRTGTAMPPGDTASFSLGFQARRQTARRFGRGRVILAGDAAHVISPIGGQGMNLGWLNAWDLAEGVHAVLRRGADLQHTLRSYEQRSRRRARQAAWRAEANMALARRHPSARRAALRDAGLSRVLDSPLAHLLARLFTMRWL